MTTYFTVAALRTHTIVMQQLLQSSLAHEPSLKCRYIENARLLNELRRRTTDLTEALEQQTASQMKDPSRLATGWG